MFFALSKTLNYLVLPLTLVIFVLLAAMVLRKGRWKTPLLWTGLGMLLFFSNEFIANEFMQAWEIDAVAYHHLRPHRLGIVLTGATIPKLEPDDRIYFQRGADRVVHTVQLFKKGLIEKILISGGSGRLIDIGEREADKFRDAMVLMGIPDSVILIENETRNTHESAVEVRKMLESLHYRDEDCLLITSAFHMRRSLACYRKVGLQLKPFTTDFYSHRTVYHFDTLFIPKIEAIMIWHKLFKEWAGFAAYRMAGYI